MNYEQFENLPFRGSMAKTSKHSWPYRNSAKMTHFSGWLHRFARQSVGKSFDMAYHYVCKRFPKNVGWFNPKEEFKSEVNYYGNPFRYNWRHYSVDSNGIIRYKEPKPRSKTVKVPVSNINIRYKLKPLTPEEEDMMYKWLASYHGSDEANFVLSTGIVPTSIGERIFARGYWRATAKGLDRIASLIEKIDLTEYKVYERGTKDFKKYHSKQVAIKDKKAKAILKERSDTANVSLKLDNSSKKARKAEIARARRAEILRNIIDRDRLGFGEDSFMGPNYNSRKGRKEKRLLEGKDVV